MAHNITPEDSVASVNYPEPTEPGFYYHPGSNNTLIYCLDYLGNWWAITSSPIMERCHWSYIEQSLSVETLVKL